MTKERGLRGLPSRLLFAGVIAALGVFYILYAGSAPMLQAEPHWFPGRTAWCAWIYLSGIVMLACALGLLSPRRAGVAARVLLVYLLLSFLLRKLPVLASAPLAIVSWESAAETATLIAGSWSIVAILRLRAGGPWLNFATGQPGLRSARIVLGFALLVFGLAHFGYLEYTASLVPAWLPWHVAWVCATGGAYLAAGLAILFRLYARLAAALTAVMMSLFQLLIWVPAVAAKPGKEDRWSELLVGWALAFSVWVVADAYRGSAWLAIGKASRANVDVAGSTMV